MINISSWHTHLDNFRVVPRLLITGYSLLMVEVSTWYMTLPDPTSQQATFVSTMVAAGAAVFGLYTNSKPNKN